jgi:hypothetical protein
MKKLKLILIILCLSWVSYSQSTLYSDKGFMMQDTTIILEFDDYTEIGLTKDVKAITIRDISNNLTYFVNNIDNIYRLDETMIESNIKATRGGVDYAITINFELYYFMIRNLNNNISLVYYLNY